MSISTVAPSSARRRWRIRIGCLLAAALVAGCSSERPTTLIEPSTIDAAADTAAVDSLLQAIEERLLLMHDVARWKWNAGKPIIDERREHEMLTDLEQRGRKLGLDRSRTRAFFSAQIDAGKRIQEADFTHWREQDHGQFAEARDLTTDLRPALDALNSELLAQLAALASRLERPEVRAAIGRRAADLPRGEGIDDAVRSTALRPLIDDQP